MTQKFAFITGGAKRIGATTTKYLHEKGFNIILHYNNSKIEEINEKLSQELGIEFVGYNTLEGLSKGLKMAKNELCTSCVTGDYSCLDIDPQYTDRMKK